MKRNVKCYIYTRVSTAVQVDGYSLDAQRDKLRKYAAYEDMIVAEEYSDMKIAKMIQRAGIEYRENRRKYRLLAHLLLPGAFIFLRLNTA